jgi:hypothetical protein
MTISVLRSLDFVYQILLFQRCSELVMPDLTDPLLSCERLLGRRVVSLNRTSIGFGAASPTEESNLKVYFVAFEMSFSYTKEFETFFSYTVSYQTMHHSQVIEYDQLSNVHNPSQSTILIN